MILVEWQQKKTSTIAINTLAIVFSRLKQFYEINELKNGKHEGNKGHYTNHVVHAPYRFSCYLSLLFSALLSHAVVPDDFLLSTISPIPKNKRKSLIDSSNYRAIALSSILSKLLDKILLTKCQHVFNTSMYQYGFKKRHSIMHCAFVVNKILQHYKNHGTNVYIALLDATKAFDRVEYVRLFS